MTRNRQQPSKKPADKVPTFADAVATRIEAVVETLTEFLRDYGKLEYANPTGGAVVFISLRGNYAYRSTSTEGKRLIDKARTDYAQLKSLLDVVLRDRKDDALKEFQQGCDTIECVLEQSWTWVKTIDEAVAGLSNAALQIVAVFDELHDHGDGTPILIPDTNTLLHHPAIHEWRFSDYGQVELLLTPTVTEELDRLKTEGRNETVRDKAKSLIRQIKGLRMRGSLLEGVDLLKGSTRLRMLAIEPKLEASLPWLDEAVMDDRILASIIEVIRQHPRSPVIALSHDLNFQNKAELAGIPCIEPPSRTSAS